MTTTMTKGSALALTDFYDVESLYDSEERLIQGSIREFVRAEVLPHVGEWWQKGHFPPELARKFGELGALGVNLPEEYGGAGASYSAYGLVCREIEYVDSGMRSFVSVQSSLVIFPIHAYATEAVKREWLPRLASGEAVGCFGLTEPDAGSDPGAMRTRCRKVGDEWVINGVKRWITSGSRVQVAVVWARDDDSGRVMGFVVPTETPGFQAVDIKTKASMRASVTSELYLDDVVVPDANRLQVEGLRGPLSCLNQARFGIAARDVLGHADVHQVGLDLTALAEATRSTATTPGKRKIVGATAASKRSSEVTSSLLRRTVTLSAAASVSTPSRATAARGSTAPRASTSGTCTASATSMVRAARWCRTSATRTRGCWPR